MRLGYFIGGFRNVADASDIAFRSICLFLLKVVFVKHNICPDLLCSIAGVVEGWQLETEYGVHPKWSST